MKNKYRLYLWILYITGLLGIVISLIPELVTSLEVRFEAIIVLLGVFVALSSWLLALIVYREKARIVDDILSGQNMVAQWSYRSSDIKRRIMEESEDKTMRNISMIVFLFIIVSLVFVPLIYMNHADWPLYAYIVLFLSFSIAMVINIRKVKYMKEQAYVILGRDGAIINDQIEWWRGRGRGFEEVYYDQKSSSLVIIYFNYFKRGARRNIVTIPVPDYVDIDIESVVEKIDM